MTEQERYKRAVSALHPDPAFRVVLQKQGKTPARVRASLRFHAGLAAILWILALSLAAGSSPSRSPVPASTPRISAASSARSRSCSTAS